MLTRVTAANLLTEKGAAVSARDYHRCLEVVTHRLEDVVAQRSEGGDVFWCGVVVYSQAHSCLAFDHLLQSKVCTNSAEW